MLIISRGFVTADFIQWLVIALFAPQPASLLLVLPILLVIKALSAMSSDCKSLLVEIWLHSSRHCGCLVAELIDVCGVVPPFDLFRTSYVTYSSSD